MMPNACPPRFTSHPVRAGRLAALLVLTASLAAATPGCAPGVDSSDPDLEAEMEAEEDVSSAEQPLVTAPVNLALGRPATQSSTGWSAPASRAVDGITNGSFGSGSVTHTLNDTLAWWQVDLGSIQTLSKIVLYNRTDCCSERLDNFSVLVSDDGSTNWRLAAFHPGATPAQITLSLNDRVTGASPRARHVRVQLNGTNHLSLAEVQVYGTPFVDLAYKKTAWQSSTYNSDGPAWHAVDGKTDGEWSHGSMSSTGWENKPWIEVDLGSQQAIGAIVLWNRKDCCGDRLSNFKVNLSNDNATWTSYDYPGTASQSVTFNVNATARYVSVQLNGYGMLSLAEIQVLSAPLSDRVRSVDLGGAAPGVTRYLERWEDGHVLDDLLDPNDSHLTGDFMGLGHDQVLHYSAGTGVGSPRVQILDHASPPASASRYREVWGQSLMLDGWTDGGDLQLAGDFRGLGRSQVMYVNRGGADGKIMIVDYAGGVVPGSVQYLEAWGYSGLLDGWLDGSDRQLVGDFMGLGRSQVMYVNRGGADGKLMIVDYAGAAPGAVKYLESWGQSGILDGWLDDDDLQLVGDFMGLGHSQVMYINRGGAGGKVMIVDYASGATGGTVKYWEDWGQTTQLGGWLDTGDVQLVGDFTGVGHDELLAFNAQNNGDGKVLVLDYGAGSFPATQRYLQPWSQAGELADWPAPRDLLFGGNFTGSGHDDLLAYHVGQSTSYTSPQGNVGCPAAQTMTSDEGCTPGCPAGQTMVDDTSCVTLVPWSGTTLPPGARVAFRWQYRQKYFAGCNLGDYGYHLFCGSNNAEPFGPAWFKLTDHAGVAFPDASALTPTASSFFAVGPHPSLPGMALRASNGLYVGGYTNSMGVFGVAANLGQSYAFDLAGAVGPSALRARFLGNQSKYVMIEDLGWGTIAGLNEFFAEYNPTEVFLVE